MNHKPKTKVFIVTGFLGAGKTTLVKRILRATPDLSKTALLVNEFGKVGVDGSLIRQTAAADIVELSSGCICCSLKTDMIQVLQKIKYEYSPEQILIEATGVADPVSVVEVLREQPLVAEFLLEKTITVLDSDLWEARESFGTVFRNQITRADLILLNKVDLLDPDAIPVILKEIKVVSPKALAIPSLHCNIDPDLFWAVSDLKDKDVQNRAARTGSIFESYDPVKDEYADPDLDRTDISQPDKAGFQTFSFKSQAPMDKAGFDDFLASVPLHLFRIKGPVKFENQTRMLNFVGGRIGWEPWCETDFTRLAFTGWSVREQDVLEQVNACLKQMD